MTAFFVNKLKCNSLRNLLSFESKDRIVGESQTECKEEILAGNQKL